MPLPVPDFRLTLDGQDLSDRFRPRLIALTLSEKRGNELDQLDITLSDHDGLLQIPAEGVTLTLALGWASGDNATPGIVTGLIDKGTFKVDEVEHSGSPDILTIRARAVDFTAAARRRNLKTYTDTTLGAVVTQLAGNAGLTARVAPDLAGIAITVLDQGRLSDMALLRNLGRRYDAVATVKAGKLLFNPIGKGTTATGRPIPAATITRGMGDSHAYKRAARDKYTGVTAYWHDPARAERTGEDAGTTENAKRLKKTFGSQSDAKAAATAEHNRQQRGQATLSFNLALGRPDLYPEQRLSLSGFKPDIDATAWLIVDVTHNLGEAGLTTSLNLETAI